MTVWRAVAGLGAGCGIVVVLHFLLGWMVTAGAKKEKPVVCQTISRFSLWKGLA